MTTLGSLFTGYGGLDLAAAAHYAADTLWTCDNDPNAAKIIAHRFPDAPNLGDITAVDWTTVPPVDVLTGGFPCQDISHAGGRAGLRPGTRSGLWTHMRAGIAQLRPAVVVVENVRGLVSAPAHSEMEPCPVCMGNLDGRPALRALGAILGDLADLRYDAEWIGLRASDVGAPHARLRIFVVARDTDRSDLHRWPATEQQGEARPTARPTADPGRDEPERRGTGREVGSAPGSGTGTARERERLRDTPRDSGAAPTDPRGETVRLGPGLRPRRPARIGRRRPDDGDHAATADPDDLGREKHGGPGTVRPTHRATERRGRDHAWGKYAPAIRRWETIIGRPAPDPTDPGPTGGRRLSPRFVEWMMGLPDGWVTAVPDLADQPMLFDGYDPDLIRRTAQLKALGNGVVPQQAAAALQVIG